MQEIVAVWLISDDGFNKAHFDTERWKAFWSNNQKTTSDLRTLHRSRSYIAAAVDLYLHKSVIKAYSESMKADSVFKLTV